mgnify:CR=1
MENNLKFNIGDKVTPIPEATFTGTWLHNSIGRVATVKAIGHGWLTIVFDDNGWRVTMPDEKWQHYTPTTQTN